PFWSPCTFVHENAMRGMCRPAAFEMSIGYYNAPFLIFTPHAVIIAYELKFGGFSRSSGRPLKMGL
ncbi:MAG: hypothetical protein J6Y80_01640, partial [Victivallales bacterium]|nr:hypothetical protein [Victivallales bacterium]